MEESLFDYIEFIDEGAFFGSGIDQFILSDDITSIEPYAFSNCFNLTLISIPPSVTKIAEYAFLNCSSLETIDIPSSVNAIDVSAFADCINLMTVTFSRKFLIENNIFLNCPLSIKTVKRMLDFFSDDELLRMGVKQETITAACFSEDTKILCLNSDSKEEYIPVKNLKKGDLVKTYLHGYKKINIMCQGIFKNNINNFRDCMYKMKKTDENGLIDDLIITGGHSILVDELTKEEHEKTVGMWNIYQIDNKYLLMAGISDKFEQIQGKEIFNYYHFSLENNGDPNKYYGVFANGVLTETPSENDIKTFKNVVFI
jgi:hypothetical protein